MIQDWLLQSTYSILGEESTRSLLEANNEGADSDIRIGRVEFTAKKIDEHHITQQNNSTIRPSQFDTRDNFILHAESVMRAWNQWILQSTRSRGCRSHMQVSLCKNCGCHFASSYGGS